MIPVTIKREYLEMIRSGSKSLEIRVGYPNILSINTGDHLLFISGSERQTVIVSNVRKYSMFSDMVAHEDFRRIIPGLNEREVLRILRQIYPPNKESLGVVVIEVYPVESAEADL